MQHGKHIEEHRGHPKGKTHKTRGFGFGIRHPAKLVLRLHHPGKRHNFQSFIADKQYSWGEGGGCYHLSREIRAGIVGDAVLRLHGKGQDHPASQQIHRNVGEKPPERLRGRGGHLY